MITELANNQIIALSREGLTSSEIAKETNLPEELVKLSLRSNNSGTEADRDISDADLALLRKNALHLALNSDNDAVKAKLTMFLIERDKPRLNNAPVTNIQVINQQIERANNRFAEMEKVYGSD